MHPFRLSRAALALASSALPLAAGAALIDRGSGLIYDTDRNLTWLSDADLLATQIAANPFLVANIISREKTVSDGSGTPHVLTVADFATPGSSRQGLASWYGATAYADYLVFQGYDDWRLPTSLQPDPACSAQSHIAVGDYYISSGTNCTGSELGHLFYDELGGKANMPLASQHNASYNLFTDVRSDYWTGTTLNFQSSSTVAADFDETDGTQNFLSLYTSPYSYSWLVRDGDIAAAPPPPPGDGPPKRAVPEPGIAPLLLIGVGAFVGLRRRSDAVSPTRRMRATSTAS